MSRGRKSRDKRSRGCSELSGHDPDGMVLKHPYAADARVSI